MNNQARLPATGVYTEPPASRDIDAPARIVRLCSRVVDSLPKRVFDFVGASVLLVLSSPLLLLIAIAIKASSRGPVFFRQRRVGLMGVPFTMLKYRSMIANADESKHREYVSSMISGPKNATKQGKVFKLVIDDRVTAIGRLLRRSSLDELPQLLNVLSGTMSLVGPRPPLEYEVALYDEWQLERLGVRPGLTGLWQVSGRSHLDYLDMCTLDVEYIHRWTFLRDVYIAVKTPFIMLFNLGGAA